MNGKLESIGKLLTNKKVLKGISIGTTIIGAIAGVASQFADSKISSLELDEKIAEALAKKGLND